MLEVKPRALIRYRGVADMSVLHARVPGQIGRGALQDELPALLHIPARSR